MLPVSYQSESSITTCVLPSPEPPACVINIDLPHVSHVTNSPAGVAQLQAL